MSPLQPDNERPPQESAPISQKGGSEGTFPNSPFSPTMRNLAIDRTSDARLSVVHYALCNEDGQEEVLNSLAKIPSSENGVHLGFSCWFNFDLIALRSPKYGVICDVDPNMVGLLDLMKEVIRASHSCDEFITTFCDRIESNENIEFYGFITGSDLLDREGFSKHVKNQGWLSSEGNFLKIKEMYDHNKIEHRLVDILDEGAFEHIHHWLKSNDLVLDTFYDSNIPEWCRLNGKLDKLVENVQSVTTPSTVVISAWKKNATGGIPQLHWSQGTHPKLTYSTSRPTGGSKNNLEGGPPKKLKF